MTQRNIAPAARARTSMLAKPMAAGAAIALVLICLFLFPVRNPDPAWGKMWMVRPIIVVTLAGACGGAMYYLLGGMRSRGGWKRIAGHALGLLIYVAGLWLGTVLGLNGTLWN